MLVLAYISALSTVLAIYPFRNTSLSWEERVEDLVSRLTIQEIQDQLANGQGPSPAIPRLGIGQYVFWSDCGRGANNQNATAFPQFIGLGASFDKLLVYEIAAAAGAEQRAWYNYFVKHKYPLDIHMGATCLDPNVDMFRDPRWGRGQETFGEDPFHIGELTDQHIHGLHGYHPRYLRVSSTCNHLALSAGPDSWPISRMDFDAKVSEYDMRTYFLPPFRRCVESGTYAFVCAYNSINGIPACADKALLTDILRGEWNFKGYIASDAGELTSIITDRHYLNNSVDTAAACLNAGCNLELQSGDWKIYNSIIPAIEQGKLTEDFVRESVRPLFYTRFRIGEFDPPSMNPYATLDKDQIVLSSEHRELALKAAINTFVLLKNENNTLPLQKNFKKIAVVGPMSNDSQDLFGDYTAFPDSRFVITPYMGLKRLASTVSLASGCNDTWCQRYDPQSVTAAIQGADIVFVCLGHGTSVESEGKDRTTIQLPGSQLQLLKDVVANTEKPVVLLLFNGGPVEISWAVDNPGVSAILECYLPGQTAGDAVYASLTNNGSFSAPAGRLSYTWPTSDEQIPGMTNFSMTERTYWYFTQEPLFPFGYGLSYTTFKYSNFSFDTEVNAGDDLSGRLIVTNTGNYDADEVIQVYISWKNISMTVPKVKLVQFLRVAVHHGGDIGFGFSIAARDMAVWQDDLGWVIKQGVMNIYVGGQQPNQKRSVGSNVEQGQFTIVGEKILGRF
ncbi:uncharacterized protein [Haliotis cracherodii]|uniref:uncharacterized protein n=1 Tax=Haliotis cracherodii TaxID=6455 RepID=UPI0039E8CA3D